MGSLGLLSVLWLWHGRDFLNPIKGHCNLGMWESRPENTKLSHIINKHSAFVNIVT